MAAPTGRPSTPGSTSAARSRSRSARGTRTTCCSLPTAAYGARETAGAIGRSRRQTSLPARRSPLFSTPAESARSLRALRPSSATTETVGASCLRPPVPRRRGRWSRRRYRAACTCQADPACTAATTGGGPGSASEARSRPSTSICWCVPPGRPDDVYAVAGGSVWSSSDAGRSWKRRSEAFADGGVEAIFVDASNPARLWAVGAGQVMRSDQQGERWRPVGKAVPDGPATARALAVSGDVIMIATDRGVFRSSDAGARWEPPKESLPAHLAASVLVRDPRSPNTFYAGFALAAYEDLRQQTPQSGSTPARAPAWASLPEVSRSPSCSRSA